MIFPPPPDYCTGIPLSYFWQVQVPYTKSQFQCFRVVHWAGFRGGGRGVVFCFVERTRPVASMGAPCLIYLYTLCVCVTFLVFTDCESCTRPISTNPGSTEAGEYGLTRGMCSRRTPSRGVRGRRAAADFVVCFGCGGIFLCFFLRSHTACCKYEAALPHLPL